MSTRFNCLIMGAAGRDFHDFQTFFREHPQFRVRAFTATQIPFIQRRVFPRELAGPEYDADIPIYPESQLAGLIRSLEIDFVFLAYSDLSHQDVMHKASLVQASGATFVLLGPLHTQLSSEKPVIAVTAVRTGAGKSPISQLLARHLSECGRRVGIIRHPMPYGDLRRQTVERLATHADLAHYSCTVEEQEEFEPYLELGLVIFAGVDYRQVLAAAEKDADVILWDGGNNDYPFIRPGLLIAVVDALRPGHEISYYPGETNFLAADVIVINKVGQADVEAVPGIRARIETHNPGAQVLTADLEVTVDHPDRIRGRRVLVVEDGPTVTHGEMAFGAGTLAAQRHGAAELIDPRPFAVGSIATALKTYAHLDRVLPALGYSREQRRELKETIERSGADVIVDASPAGLNRLLQFTTPSVRVRYHFQQRGGPLLTELVDQFIRNNPVPPFS